MCVSSLLKTSKKMPQVLAATCSIILLLLQLKKFFMRFNIALFCYSLVLLFEQKEFTLQGALCNQEDQKFSLFFFQVKA